MKISALFNSPPLEGWQAQPDGVVSYGQTTPRLRRTPPTEGNLSQRCFPMPEWHEKVLAERAKQVKQGLDGFSDWSEAKRRIRENLAR